jgi:uncharacterized protein YndB with AHSA1/START domain
MTQAGTPTSAIAEDQLVITRTFDAPRSLVFDAWTDPQHLARWWGAPKGSTVRVAKFELVPGGLFVYALNMPQGGEIWGRFVYREIVAPERLVYVNSFSDPQGGVAANPWIPDWPLEILNTLTFEEHDGKTTLTLVGSPIGATVVQMEAFRTMRQSMQGGFAGMFQQLDEFLQDAKREITASRVVDAPRDLVFQAFTDPAHVTHWWGPNGFTLTLHEMDVRPGGNWRFIMHGPDGRNYDNHHVFVEVARPERLVLDHVSEPRHQATWTLEELDGGRTRVSVRMVFETPELRTFVAEQFKAVEGAQQTLGRLAEHVVTARAAG